MKCPTCVDLGQKSSVHSQGATSTLMYNTPYWDEEGVYHIHDRNSHHQFYRCNKGHEWMEIATNTCPAGDFAYKPMY